MTDAVLVDDDGNRTAYVGPELVEDLPPVVLEGLTRRRLVGIGQSCPCGARMVVPNREARRAARKASVLLPVTVEHEDDCAAIAPELEAYVRRRR